MSSCKQVVPLTGSASDNGLFEDVDGLASGRVRLRLRGRYACRDNDRPFYRFDILSLDDAALLGEITFMPEHDRSVVGVLGHSGGGLEPGARGKTVYRDALEALGPLAQRHGLEEFVVTFPSSNISARRFVEKLQLHRLDRLGEYERYLVPTMPHLGG